MSQDTSDPHLKRNYKQGVECLSQTIHALDYLYHERTVRTMDVSYLGRFRTDIVWSEVSSVFDLECCENHLVSPEKALDTLGQGPKCLNSRDTSC